LLNPDAEMDEGALAILLDAAKRYPEAGILTPELYGCKGEVQECYRRSFFDRKANGGIFLKPEGDLCAGFLTGTAMLLNMSKMKKIGFFDPRMFLFYEDDEICLKVREHGYELVHVPQSKVFHAEGMSSGSSAEVEAFKQYHMAWSRLYLYEKYIGKFKAKIHAAKLVGVYCIKTLVFLVLRKGARYRLVRARLVGTFSYLLGRR
jgi:N-acetylglucosaminyl-diphospho-decaprenol L-rhamnosyltransferase